MAPNGYLVSEAASTLDVAISQIHRWIDAGVVASEIDASGRHWIPAHEVAYRARLPGNTRRGKPPSQQVLWSMLAEISDSIPLSAAGAERLGDRRFFERRSTRRAGHALPEVIEELRDREDVAVGGVEAAAEAGAPVVEERPPWDLYVPFTMIDRYGTTPRLRRTAREVNIVLHFVEDPILEQCRKRFGNTMPPIVAWLDLADAGDRAAPEIWTQLAEDAQ